MRSTSRSDAAHIEFVPADYFRPVDLAEVFPRPAPLEIDLGCGDGRFLAALALRQPERNFLGIERLLGRVRDTAVKAASAKLENVRVLRIESSYALTHLLPAGSVSVLHVMFPDPWPKRRHWPRRLFHSPFLQAVHRVLTPSGEFRFVTDHKDYFAHAQKVVAAHPEFADEPWREPEDYPQTGFEKRFRTRGLPIYRMVLRRA